MSADMSADELRILIGLAQALLETVENLQDNTQSKPRRDSDSNQEGLRARAHDLQSSSPVTPTVVTDDDKWIWTPWDTRKHGVSSFIQRQSLRVDGIVADQVDLSVSALACRDSAHAEVNAIATAQLETLGEHSNLKRHRTLRPRRLGRVSSPPPPCRSLREQFTREHRHACARFAMLIHDADPCA